MKNVELTKEMLSSFLDIGEMIEDEENSFSFATTTTDRIFLLSEDFNSLEDVESYLKNTDDICEIVLGYNKNTEKCAIYFLWQEREQREYNLVGDCVELLKEKLNEIIELEK